jgi:hypothetical protein
VIMKSSIFWDIKPHSPLKIKPSDFTLVSCSAYFPTLKMEEKFSSETSVDFQRATLRYVPEDITLRYDCNYFHRLNTV